MNCSWMSVLAAAMAVATAGCFDYEENLMINKDGSGEVAFHYAIDREYVQQLEDLAEAMGGLMGEDSAEIGAMFAEWSEDSIRSMLAATTEGVELKSYRAWEDEGSKVWDMAFSFADLSAVAGIAAILNSDDEESSVDDETEDSQIFFTKQADGTWLYLRPLSAGGGSEEESMGEVEEETEAADAVEGEEELREGSEGDTEEGVGESAEPDMGEMAEMFAGHRVRFVVTFPGKVIESNATSVEGNVAVWEYGLDEMPELQEMRAVIEED